MGEKKIFNPEKNILIAEDDRSIRELLRDILHDENYNVSTAEDGREAIEKVKSETPDLVILDVKMPGIDGYEVCKRIREDSRLKKVPVIFLTVMKNTSDRIKGHKLGVDDYITKPVEPEEFIARVKSVLSRRDVYEEISMTDSLTGLYNINFYKKQIQWFFKMAKRNKRVFSIAVADVNGFKKINDEHGHKTGDYVLKKLADLLKKNLRESDVVVRYGGDEFVIIFPDLGSTQVRVVSDKIKEVVESEKFIYNNSGKAVPVSLSVGTATWDSESESPDKLFEKADKNMYEDKNKCNHS